MPALETIPLVTLARVAFIIVGAFVGAAALHAVTHRFFETMFAGAGKGRLETIHRVAILGIRGVVYIVATLMVLSELGLNIGPLLASLGIVGFAFSFGAQTFIRDVISGIFLVFEDHARVGDEVAVGGIRGRVVELKPRTLVIQDQDGTLHFTPYGDIKAIANFSRRS